MAQDFTPWYRSIWSDEDWRELTSDAQWAYQMLASHPDRNEAGLLSVTKRKWVRLARGMTSDRLDAALVELDDAGFIVVDEDTEELLVRSYVRSTKVYLHIRMMSNALRRMTEVESDRIRSALGQELVRIPRLAIPVRTERNVRMVEEAIATQQQLDVVASMLCDAPPDPPGQSAAHPMGHGMPDGMAHPPVVVAGAVAVAGAGTALTDKTSRNKSLESNARAAPPIYELCPDHPGERRRNCRGCAADRKAAS
jgi:hypothetical protein